MSAEQIGLLIRRHWGIENGLHWVLDMAFHEDQAHERSKHCAENLTTLRYLALNLIRNYQDDRYSVPRRRQLCDYDRDYRGCVQRAAAGA